MTAEAGVLCGFRLNNPDRPDPTRPDPSQDDAPGEASGPGPFPRLRFVLTADAAASLSVLREAFDGWDTSEEARFAMIRYDPI